MKRRTPAALLFLAVWLPAAILILSCGLVDECAEGDVACQAEAGGGLTPEAQRIQSEGQQKLLGTWELVQQLDGKDEVDRPVSYGWASWTLEIFEVEAYDPYGSTPRVSWRGALRPGVICVVPTEKLGEDAACEELPGLLGSCQEHSCTEREELELEGLYDTQSDLMEFGSYTQGVMHFANPEQGYLTLSAYVDGDLYLAQGGEPNACVGSFCDWRLNPVGLLADRYPTESGTRSRTFLRINETYRRDKTVREEQATVMIDSAAPVEEKLLGDWRVRMTLGTLDPVERPFNLGYADYDLELFTVEAYGLVGQWRVKGALEGRGLCVAPTATASADRDDCDLYEPAIIGSCDAASCTEKGEVAIEGVFDALRGELTLDEEQAGLYYLDPARGYVNVSLYVSADAAALPLQRIEPTACAGSIWCDWRLRSAGAFADDYSSSWKSDALYFEMDPPFYAGGAQADWSMWSASSSEKS